MNKKKKILILSISLGIVALGIVIGAILLLMKKDEGYRVIKVESYEGDVKLQRSTKEKNIFKGMNLISSDKVTTGKESLMEILADSDKHILAKENTCFSIVSTGDEKNGKIDVKLEYGTSLIEIENKLTGGAEFNVNTPNATASVRGTIFEVSYDKDKKETVIVVTEGTVQVTSAKGTVMLNAGDKITVTSEGELLVQLYSDDNNNDGEDVDAIDSIGVPKYTDEIAFDLNMSDSFETVGLGVKQLEGWEHVITELNVTTNHHFEKYGLNMFYTALDKRNYEIEFSLYENDNIERLIQIVNNADGDEITVVTVLSEGYSGECDFYKQIGEDLYLKISIDETYGKSFDKIDINEFLNLTTDSYFVKQDNGNENIDINPILKDGITEDELPEILKGNVNRIQFEFILGVMQDTKIQGKDDYLNQMLYKIYFGEMDRDVCSPISITNSGYVYDLSVLNNMLSVITDEKINESNILNLNSLNGNELMFETCTVSTSEWIEITIDKYSVNNNEILVEFSYEKMSGGGQYVNKGRSIAHLLPDEDGKYGVDSIEEVTSEKISY